MNVRLITLPSGRRITIREYVRCWKLLKQMDPNTEVANWEWFPMKARDILRQISEGVQDRINQAIPRTERGM